MMTGRLRELRKLPLNFFIRQPHRARAHPSQAKLPQLYTTPTSVCSMSTSPNGRFVMPAEWQPHSRTVTVWPDKASIKEPHVLEAARREVSAIANEISGFEPVTLYTKPQNVDQARQTVSSKVDVVELEASELWVRDTGPIVVKNTRDGSLTGIGLNFNYWGGKLPDVGDGQVAKLITSHLGVPFVSTSYRGEGGGIEVDGEGTMLVTESCIINSNRNEGLSKQDIEKTLQDILGVQKVLWLKGLKDYDITDDHVDALARFVSPGVVIMSRPPEGVEEAVTQRYLDAKRALEHETDANGRTLRIVEIQEPADNLLPKPHYEFEPPVLSYVNVLLVNGAVLIPKFGIPETDKKAAEVFRGLFEDREIVQVDLHALPQLGGGIHCATQQIPNAA